MLWKKVSNLHEVVSQSTKFSGRPWSAIPVCNGTTGSILRLSVFPHPRDKRACLPKISSLHSISKELIFIGLMANSCRGRGRTSTRWLAIAQSSVVDPGRLSPFASEQPALHYVYPMILTPETRGHVCQKFHHPTVYGVLPL